MMQITHQGFTLFTKTHSAKVSNQAGAMLLGAVLLLAIIFIGSVI